MEKKVKIRNICWIVSGIICVISYFLVFATPIYNLTQSYAANWITVNFGDYAHNASPAGFIGFGLNLIAGSLLIILGAKNLIKKNESRKLDLIFVISSLILLFVGSVLLFCLKGAYLNANKGIVSGSLTSFGAGPLIGGAIGIISFSGSIAGISLK